MIKELNKKTAKTKTGYAFGTIKLVHNIDYNVKLRIPEQIINYKEQLDNMKTIQVRKKKGFIDADIVPIYITNLVWCVSTKFRNIFEGKLKGYWWNTSNKDYHIFLLNNIIDALDKEKTIIEYEDYHEKFGFDYKFIENESFIPDIEENEYLFSCKEESVRILSTDKFESLVKEYNITGFQFYKQINFTRRDGTLYDGFRFGKYDDEGNCINDPRDKI